MPRGRECSDSCIEYLALELVHHYKRQQHGPPLHSAAEAVGLRVGRQLMERYSKDVAPLPDHKEGNICFEGYPFPVAIPSQPKSGSIVLGPGAASMLQDQAVVFVALRLYNLVAIPKKQLAQDYLHLPCAILRGALTQLGLDCTVSADASHLPQCDFTVIIKIQK